MLKISKKKILAPMVIFELLLLLINAPDFCALLQHDCVGAFVIAERTMLTIIVACPHHICDRSLLVFKIFVIMIA